MANTWTETIEEIRRRLEEFAEAIGEALVPQPERARVPVRGRRPSRGQRRD